MMNKLSQSFQSLTLKIMNMKKSLNLLLVIFAAGITAFYLNSCDQEARDNDTSVAYDNGLAEQIFSDVKAISDQASSGQLTTFIPDYQEGLLSGCATVTLDNTSTPKKITVDFGSANCLCNDQRTRRGKIIITYTGAYRDSGTVINISFEDYYVNDNQVLGVKTITNNGTNSSGHLNYTVVVDGKIKKADGDSIIWKSTRNNEWIEGSATPALLDDVYLITGNASGVSASGLPFTVTITKALRKEIGFKHFVSGTIEIEPQGKFKRILDYGDGTRDNKATVTINNRTFDIILY